MKKLIQIRYTSQKATICGFHRHINQSALGTTHTDQENTIGRILYFIEHNRSPILRFSRHTEGQMQKRAARHGIKNRSKELV